MDRTLFSLAVRPWFFAGPVMAVARVALVALVAVFAAVAATGCRPARDTRPLLRCEDTCARHAAACSAEQCARGCRLAVDREVEGAGAAVFACVAASRSCEEPIFARCAVRQGVHADGGPGVPKSFPDDD